MSSKMLSRLKENIETIEITNVSDFNFLQSIFIQKELNPKIKLTKAEFSKLISMDNKYTKLKQRLQRYGSVLDIPLVLL